MNRDFFMSFYPHKLFAQIFQKRYSMKNEFFEIRAIVYIYKYIYMYIYNEELKLVLCDSVGVSVEQSWIHSKLNADTVLFIKGFRCP